MMTECSDERAGVCERWAALRRRRVRAVSAEDQLWRGAKCATVKEAGREEGRSSRQRVRRSPRWLVSGRDDGHLVQRRDDGQRSALTRRNDDDALAV